MGHIVDELIKERSEGLRTRPWLWKFITTALYPILGYKKAIALIDAVQDKEALDILRHVSDLLLSLIHI